MRLVLVTDRCEIEKLIEFAQGNSFKPVYSATLMLRFFTEFISSRNLIFDLHDDRGRVAVAVLLDELKNSANDASLEIVGVRADVAAELLIPTLVALAEAVVPSHRSGFQFNLSEGAISDRGLLPSLGVQEYYETFEMVARDWQVGGTPNEIRAAELSDRDEVYEMLRQSFAENIDVNIPDAEVWKRNFLRAPDARTFLWQSDKMLLGFLNLVFEDESAEIRTLGVLPQARGLGIGSHLLRHAMDQSTAAGKTSCYLTVAVQNINALQIYLRAGFKTVERIKCYRKPV